MYKLVIVDDEPFIVKLIEKLIDHDRLDIQVAGTTTDSSEALELMRKLRPDILITDIRMPCMDGLALIEHLNQSDLNVSIIAISGHRRFDYAYSALKSGVEDYLIKPISRQNLNNALEKICNRLSSLQNENDDRRELEERMAQNAQRMREKLIMDALYDELHAESIEQLNREYMYHFSHGSFMGFTIRIDLPESGTIHAPILQSCKEQAEASFGELCADMELIQQDDCLYGLLNTHMDAETQLNRRAKAFFERLLVALEPYEVESVCIGIGHAASDLAELSRSLKASRSCAGLKCILGGNRICYSYQYDWEERNCCLQPSQIEELRKISELRAADQLPGWFASVFCKPEEYYLLHPVESLSLMESIVYNFEILCRLLGIVIPQEPWNSLLRRMLSGHGFRETLGHMNDSMKQWLQHDEHRRMERDSYPVQRAKEYIENNLHTPLNLRDIAEYVQLNPNYLSKLFKDDTGKGISDYILALRVERAKALLRTTSYNINQISDQVGYQDAKHFSKQFRKLTGIYMQDYRKMYTK